MLDLQKYVGIPYKDNGRDATGIDCWGLVRHFYSNELSIELPSYAELYNGAWDPSISVSIEQYKDGWDLHEKPEFGDVVLFRVLGDLSHVGVYVGNNQFIHARDGKDSVLERLDNFQWAKRVAGYYRYNNKSVSVNVTGIPNPFQPSIIKDVVHAGSSVQQFVDYLNTKYSIKPSTKLVLTLDGVPIPEDQWSDRIIQEGEQVTYKVLPKGKGSMRLVLAIALAVAAPQLLGAMAGVGAAGVTAGIAAGGVSGFAYAAGLAAINMAGQALINAILPIRPPAQQDPGEITQSYMLSGAQNQVNRFGPIPVVLGKMRITGVLGATPYMRATTNSNIANLLIVWGFGPLSIWDICSGGSPIQDAMLEGYSQEAYSYSIISASGSPAEDTQLLDRINQAYPNDIEQINNVVELVNDGVVTPNIAEFAFVQESTEVELVLSCPEGMRQINTGSGEAGDVYASIEILLDKYNGNTSTWVPMQLSRGKVGTGLNTSTAFQKPYYRQQVTTKIQSPEGDYTTITYIPVQYTLALNTENNAVEEFKVTADTSDVTRLLESGNFIPVVLDGTKYIKLYTFTITSSGTLTGLINHLPGQTQGVDFVYTAETLYTDLGGDSGSTVSTYTKVTVKGGIILQDPQNDTGVVQVPVLIFNLKGSVGTSIGLITTPQYFKNWCRFLKDEGVWIPSTDTTSIISGDWPAVRWQKKTGNISFPYTGYYTFKAAVDDRVTISLLTTQDALYEVVFTLPNDGWKSEVQQQVYIPAGTYKVQIDANNTGGAYGLALTCHYHAGVGLNKKTHPNSIVTLGAAGLFQKQKDAFNYVHRITGLEKARYRIKAKRLTSSVDDDVQDIKKYFKVVTQSAACFNNTRPVKQPPVGNLALTVAKLPSSSKVNGEIAGINAMVFSQGWDFGPGGRFWNTSGIDNPASLFIYVLTHPANAYRIADFTTSIRNNVVLADAFWDTVEQKIDIPTIMAWHTFCNSTSTGNRTTQLRFNSVITQTTSVMDVLRDICAAGMASPAFINGKWTVVVDKERTGVTQVFTPHNSWGFEATKTLPKLPDAFRVTIADEANRYQANELIVYNYDKNEANAEIYEELQLPGVTSAAQAVYLAKFHMAQLKLRPETYTLNVDFEYLVCTRGDLVKVTHDVPMWGVGSARVKNVVGNVIYLNDSILMETGKTYIASIRLPQVYAGNIQIDEVTLTNVSATGYYDSITVASPLPIPAVYNDAACIVSVGTAGTISQNLVVISIEPQANTSAKLTLVDYSAEIYTTPLNDLNVQYTPMMSKGPQALANKVITKSPINLTATPSEPSSNFVAVGNYVPEVVVSVDHPSDLPPLARIVQVEVIPSDNDFNIHAPGTMYEFSKDSGQYVINNLAPNTMHKARARYCNNERTVFGKWQDMVIFAVGGSGLQPTDIGDTNMYAYLENTNIIAGVLPTYERQSDFQHFEFKIFKNDTIVDIWNYTPDGTNKIETKEGLQQVTFDLRNQSSPRISITGVAYVIGCRAVNKTGMRSLLQTAKLVTVTTL